MIPVSAEPVRRGASAEAAEAARYALLRRLAPSMRHHLVVNLQPIGMIYEVLDRRLKAAEPDIAYVQDSAHKINGFAKAALNSCLDVVSWLSPEDGASSSVSQAVEECAALLATSLGFRGYHLRNEVQAVEGRIARAAVRNLLTAVLLWATDEHAAPAQLVLHAASQPRGVRVTLTVEPGGEGTVTAAAPGYRSLQWSDVAALAAAEDVELERVGGGEVRLLFAWTPA